MRIGVDIDGVIARLVTLILSVANGEEFHFRVPDNPTDYHLGLTTEQMQEVMTYIAHCRLLVDEVRPYDGASARLKTWRKRGHIVEYITFRGACGLGNVKVIDPHLLYDLRAQTRQWLYRYDFVGPVHYVTDKLGFCAENNIPVLLEDCLEVAQQSLTLSGTTPKVILIDQPWNQCADYPWRAKTINHVVDFVPELGRPAELEVLQAQAS